MAHHPSWTELADLEEAHDSLATQRKPVEICVRQLGVQLAPRVQISWPEKLRRVPRRQDNHSPKQLLHGISAGFNPGSLTAILGASGSGKTTLLDVLSGRLDAHARITSGAVSFNREPDLRRVRHAHVTQRDVLVATLTVRETLRYAAELRLPPHAGRAHRHAVVERVIAELSLQKCADTRVGDRQDRGCSGGEKRRVSIGIQLLTDPSVLFLDEPTTGLDAAGALSVVSTLQHLALKQGLTIIMSIHQPRSEIWRLIDSVVVLAEGRCTFAGAVSDALPWFEACGFVKPRYANPADFIIDTTAIDLRNAHAERDSRRRVAGLQTAWQRESEPQLPSTPTSSSSSGPLLSPDSRDDGRICSSAIRQAKVQTERTLKVTWRDPLGMTACVSEAILMGLVVGYMFFNLGRDQTGIRSRQGCLYVAASLQGYIVLIFETYRLTLDMPIFDREHIERCVTPWTFLLSRRLARLPTEDLPVPLILSLFVYFMAGLGASASNFAIFFAVTFVNHYIAITCATACVVINRNFPVASLLASLIYTLQSIASGFIVQIETIPVYLRWTRWVTYTFYTFIAYVENEFQDQLYDCPFPRGQEGAKCAPYDGNSIITTLGLPRDWKINAILCMTAFALGLTIFSLVGLIYFKAHASSVAAVSLPRKTTTDNVEMVYQQSQEIITQPATVELRGFHITLGKRWWQTLGSSPIQKTVVGPVTARFGPGLNVILGPSGSGKSSLLNALGGRTQPSASVVQRELGLISVTNTNGEPLPLDTVFSFVDQSDEMLLPALSVRETLRYAAKLRLPCFMSATDKCRRADEVLVKLGLRSCADTLIGSDAFRGISGGEKRRVSLAVQILGDPQVLLVDEPTSGLDAFTANSIVQVLYGLAEEGRTIIMAIHQPRSDLYQYFGYTLVLNSAGSPAYFGPASSMVEALRRRGYDCPSETNPADFVLDLVSNGSVQSTVFDGLEDDLVEAKSELADDETVSRANDSCVNLQKPEAAAISSRPVAKNRVPSMRSTCISLLVRRMFLNTRRQPQLLLARIMQACGVAILFTLFFAPLDDDYRSLQTRLGFLQQLGGFYIIGMLTNAAIYPFEREVASREIQDGAYSRDDFLVTYSIVGLPFEIFNSLFFGVLAVFAVGLPHDAATYFVAALACFSGLSCGESLGIIFHSLFAHTGFAINLMSVFLALANSMAGILSLNMPPLLDAFNYLSPIRYQVRALGYYTLRDVSFGCNFNESCPVATGEEALELYGFDEGPVASVGGLLACVVVYRLAAWLVLRMSR